MPQSQRARSEVASDRTISQAFCFVRLTCFPIEICLSFNDISYDHRSRKGLSIVPRLLKIEIKVTVVVKRSIKSKVVQPFFSLAFEGRAFAESLMVPSSKMSFSITYNNTNRPNNKVELECKRTSVYQVYH